MMGYLPDLTLLASPSQSPSSVSVSVSVHLRPLSQVFQFLFANILFCINIEIHHYIAQ